MKIKMLKSVTWAFGYKAIHLDKGKVYEYDELVCMKMVNSGYAEAFDSISNKLTKKNIVKENKVIKVEENKKNKKKIKK